MNLIDGLAWRVHFALGGLIYGPFVPLTYALFQSATARTARPAAAAP